MIECEPTRRRLVVNVAWPAAFSVPVPSVGASGASSLNVTVPVGVPSELVTVAVNVTACRTSDWLGDGATGEHQERISGAAAPRERQRASLSVTHHTDEEGEQNSAEKRARLQRASPPMAGDSTGAEDHSTPVTPVGGRAYWMVAVATPP